MTIVTSWRITKTKYTSNITKMLGEEIPSAFDGEGAKRFPGRWNSNGVPMVYTSGSQALAVLEILANLQNANILAQYSIYAINFDTKQLLSLNGGNALPSGWQESPAGLVSRQIGDAWVQDSASLVLEVPSAIIPAENNYLINPYHKGFSTLKIGKPQCFPFDTRLYK